MGAETTNPHGFGTCLFWGTRATNFPIYTTKMKGAGPQILGTGAKFKRVPCQKSCRVNRASEGSKKMKRPKPSSSRRASIEEELKIVDCHILKDKSSISENLKNLDEGNLTFPKHELLPW